MMTSGKSSRGFTLIELMVTVVIVAILAAIAYPSYMRQVREGKRTEGKTKLMKGAQLQERYYTDHNAYAGTSVFPTLFGLSSGATVYSSDDGTQAHASYVITINTSTPSGGFTLTATPTNGFSDTECGNLTLNSYGVKGVSGGTQTDASKCW